MDDLGDSRYMAVQRLNNLNKHLVKDKDLAEKYEKFMTQYLTLGHMEVLPPNKIPNKLCYLPHHAVIKSDNLNTKVRVVFYDSAPSKSDVSLNDIMA